MIKKTKEKIVVEKTTVEIGKKNKAKIKKTNKKRADFIRPNRYSN